MGVWGKFFINSLKFCENRVLGKHKKVSFVKGTHRTVGISYYIHSDLSGPSRIVSVGGKSYFKTLIDD